VASDFKKAWISAMTAKLQGVRKKINGGSATANQVVRHWEKGLKQNLLQLDSL
jgi:hypothetical protein